MELTYGQHLDLLLWDKGISFVTVIAIGAVLNHVLNSRAKARERLANAEDEARHRRREFALAQVDKQIEFLEQKLEKFLWPLSLCFQTDSILWKAIPQLHQEAKMPRLAGSILESQTLLPNHYKAVALIEQNYHLVADEITLHGPMLQYVQHVAVYRALREASADLNPIDVHAPYPSEFESRLQEIMEKTRTELGELRNKRTRHASAMASEDGL